MKFRRKGVIALTAALYVALFASTAMAAYDDATLRSEMAAGGTVTLTDNITIDEGQDAIVVTQDAVLDLNGKTLKRESTSSDKVTYIIRVHEDATLTINDSTGGGIMTSSNPGNQNGRCIEIGNGTTGGTVIMNGGTLIADYREPEGNVYGGQAVRLNGNVSYTDRETSVNATFTMRGGKILAGMAGVAVFGKTSTVNIEGGEIESYAYGITGNGTNSSQNGNYGGTVINISGGTVTSKLTSAIYQPQAGSINVTGGTITGYDGIQMKSGTLIMSGGTLEGTGEFNDNYTYEEGQHDGTIATGAALALLSEGNSVETGYSGNITVEISGSAVLRSQNGYAVAEAYSNYESDSIVKFNGIKITGGTILGAADKAAMVMTNAENSNTTITGGTFSSELSKCDGLTALTNLPTMTQDENGNYVAVTEPATDLDIDESNLAELIVDGTLQLKVGQTLQLKAILTPVESNDRVVWSSSDEAVATVDQNGLVKAVAVGTVSISASITRADFSVEDVVAFTIVPATTSDDVKPQPSGSGGGCSAGFGALALLAALPLLRMRKK